MANYVEFNGQRYQLPDQYTHREAGIFKRIAGLRLLELDDAMKAGDSDAIVALAVIAMRRAGVVSVNEDVLFDSPIGAIVVTSDEDQEAPPTEAASSGNGSGETSPEPIPTEASGTGGLPA